MIQPPLPAPAHDEAASFRQKAARGTAKDCWPDIALMAGRQRFMGEKAAVRPGSRVHVLLSTFNGEAFLRPQLESLLQQTHTDWILYWRDDGSTDRTAQIMAAFTSAVGPERCMRIEKPTGRLYPAASYLAMIRATLPMLGPDDAIAFADQDDLWLPSKLGRGVAALTVERGTGVPTLYSARLRMVDSQLKRLAETRISASKCGFPESLTQNIATGCTIMLNRPAARMVARSAAPASSMHDWWCYLLVSAAGGRIVVDDAVVALYRQHDNNFVGMQRTWLRRGRAAIRRGPSLFMNILRQHVAALLAQPELMDDAARQRALRIQRALEGGPVRRMTVLGMRGLRRQTWSETMLFRLWFLIG